MRIFDYPSAFLKNVQDNVMTIKKCLKSEYAHILEELDELCVDL